MLNIRICVETCCRHCNVAFLSFLQQDHYEYLIYLNVKKFFARTKSHRDTTFCGPFFLIYIQIISIELKKVWKGRYKIKWIHFHLLAYKQFLVAFVNIWVYFLQQMRRYNITTKWIIIYFHKLQDIKRYT